MSSSCRSQPPLHSQTRRAFLFASAHTSSGSGRGTSNAGSQVAGESGSTNASYGGRRGTLDPSLQTTYRGVVVEVVENYTDPRMPPNPDDAPRHYANDEVGLRCKEISFEVSQKPRTDHIAPFDMGIIIPERIARRVRLTLEEIARLKALHELLLAGLAVSDVHSEEEEDLELPDIECDLKPGDEVMWENPGDNKHFVGLFAELHLVDGHPACLIRDVSRWDAYSDAGSSAPSSAGTWVSVDTGIFPLEWVSLAPFIKGEVVIDFVE